MKVVLLITLMFNLFLVRGHNHSPCWPTNRNNAYTNFLHGHVLHQTFNRMSYGDWRGYLQQNNLCHKQTQTFMERSDQRQVERICTRSGWRYNSYSNLCISNSPIKVYELKVDNNCQIQQLVVATRYVVVACDAINNVCRPVHFEESTNQRPHKQHGRCEKKKSAFSADGTGYSWYWLYNRS